ncbi:EamA family transporter [Aestuariicoccus sp. MJ-SS9]|uniref:EamA family transporter n=1 Tax=Aestuariicoccus sp. MJ-SS9 TaxID=3079855 RepID=UPI00290B8B5C|nr:EamA family transporter [Aestuariicoccus sp. MJ-SS9]MDU8912798.1 EamA family transporter [Aestuariicoccus sp. MJ-SS9]
MDPFVFFAVLCAAALHAAWNSAIRLGTDRASAILLLSLSHGVIGLAVLVFVEPPAPQSYPWLVASAALHLGYQLFLVQAYAHGDLSQAYPLARGSAPMIVTLVSVAFLGVALSASDLLATLLISGGILTMALLGGGRAGRLRGKALAWALGTACFTAGYTLVDGLGARASGAPTGYLMWMFVLNSLGMIVWALVARGPSAFAVLRPSLGIGLAAGVLSVGSYWIAIWAFTQAPIALVAALRESSILFALLIAAFVIGEKVDRYRWLAGGLIAAGVVAMRL